MSELLEAGEKLAAENATGPRVTLQNLEDKVARHRYIIDGTLTICILELTNGYKLVGKSAPASMNNFDVRKGEKFAYEDALRQLWPLEGYVLRENLHKTEQVMQEEQLSLLRYNQKV